MTTRQSYRVRELTDMGIRDAKDYLASLREGKSIPFPDALLTNPLYATEVEPAVYVTQQQFSVRRDVALYLTERLSPLPASRVIENYRLWSWLGMFYFDTVARKDADGNPRLGRDPDVAYVANPAVNSQTKWGETRRFAHRLMLAYEIYTHHAENAWYMLNEPVNSLGRFTMRLTSAPEIFRARGIVELAHLLYIDRKTGGMRSGWGWTNDVTAPPGSLPRLIDVLGQLYMNYDVYGMSPEQILPLLPPEFDRFKPASAVGYS